MQELIYSCFIFILFVKRTISRRVLLHWKVMSAWVIERDGQFGRDISADNLYSINCHFSERNLLPYAHGGIKGIRIRTEVY